MPKANTMDFSFENMEFFMKVKQKQNFSGSEIKQHVD